MDQQLAFSYPTTVAPGTQVGITESVRVTPVGTAGQSFLLKPDGDWTAKDLQAYVVAKIEERFGPFPRDLVKEAAIFGSFMTRFEANAPLIARYAFETEKGMWAGAPVRVHRFTRGNDAFFSNVIMKLLGML